MSMSVEKTIWWKASLFSAACLCLSVCLVRCGRPENGSCRISVEKLSCEYSCGCPVIDNGRPQFGWIIGSEKQTHTQSAYRIMAASSEALLEKDAADLWDSGKTMSSESCHVLYGGDSLSSRQEVYWKVMVWDEDGRPSSWSRTAEFNMALMSDSDWKAVWIGRGEDMYPDSAVTFPAPYFRKEFSIGRPVRKATAYICGLGFYELSVNGKKAGDQVLAPAVSDYGDRRLSGMLYPYDDCSSKRVYYNAIDVTHLLRKGINAAGVVLGNGWFNQRDRTVEGHMWYTTPRMLCRIEIEYMDGTAAAVLSDTTWRVSSGALVHDGIFTGEKYDARLAFSGWDRPGFDDSGWQHAVAVCAPSGDLRVQQTPYDKVTGFMYPVSCDRQDDSTYLFTFPEMISGWVRLDVRGRSGDIVRLEYIGEEGEDFGQEDVYVLGGRRKESWSPGFTWHAFRTVRAVSRNVHLGMESLMACRVNTDVEDAGSFQCSDTLFNRIAEAYVLTQRNNFHGSISSDCPHRERLAYTGDAQVAAESAMYCFDMTRFYGKWLDDMSDAMNRKTGFVPHTAPFGGGGGGPAWGSAYVIIPWLYYCHYGDLHLLRKHYAGMCRWVEYLGTRTDCRGIVVREEPGSWCLGEWCVPGQLSISAELVNTAYYYHVSDIMRKTAAVIGNAKDAACFSRLCEKIKEDFNEAFFDSGKGRYLDGRQGSDVFPLAFGLVPQGREEDVLEDLLDNLQRTGYHFDTGILGTPLMLEVLSRNGYSDIAFRLMDNRTYPGFGYLLDSRNSCLWENWEGNSSRCHPMFGSVVSWLYRYIGGIRYDEDAPGMKTLVIGPHPAGDLKWCRCSCRTLYGEALSSWKIEEGKFSLDIRIPSNSSARVILPDGREYEAGPGIHAYTVEPESPACQNNKKGDLI